MSLSYYDLAFEIGPGAADKDTHYVRGSLAEVKQDLAAELAQQHHLFLLVAGATLNLDVYQQGRHTDSIDLLPFLTISIAGYPDITFTGPDEPVGYDFDDEDPGDDTALISRMFSAELGDTVEVTVHWDQIEVPPLRGQVAHEGDAVELQIPMDSLPGRVERTAKYGYQDYFEN
ncbi:hypothetical protein [Streptomyces sp. 3N207]|uniref:hypothetical protein n=1 Tax=Streptomyces sp. 3N207 TaxID=3457417 RepID=UPI003FD5240B